MDNRGLYPSVTEILSPYIAKDWFTDESRDRGTAVHAAISAHLQGVWVKPLAPDHQPYFDSARRWIDLAVDKVILVETRLKDHGLKYCGKPDLVCVLNGDDVKSLVDFKTAQAESNWWKIQTAAYRQLCVVGTQIVTDRAVSVRTKKDGTGCLTNDHKRFRENINLFMGALNLWKFFKEG